MRSFDAAYPKVNALRSELSWTHCRLLLRLDKPEGSGVYEMKAVNARWSTCELERQINSLQCVRLAVSRDKEGAMELALSADLLRPVTIDLR